MRLSLAVIVALGALVQGCTADRDGIKPAGDSEHGRLLLRQYGCGSCHRIPGVVAAEGNVGPPLARIGVRAYLAGMLPNRPENMVRWIRAPQSVDPLTGMPDLKVPEQHARDMSAYLQTLR